MHEERNNNRLSQPAYVVCYCGCVYGVLERFYKHQEALVRARILENLYKSDRSVKAIGS